VSTRSAIRRAAHAAQHSIPPSVSLAWRLRLGISLLLILMVTFLAVDFVLRGQLDELTVTHLVRIAVLSAVLPLLREETPRPRLEAAGLLGLTATLVGSVVAGILSASPLAAPVFSVTVAWAAATMMPWGLGPQLVTVACGVVVISVQQWLAVSDVDMALIARDYVTVLCALGLSLPVNRALALERSRHALRAQAAAHLQQQRDAYHALVDAMHRAEQRFLREREPRPVFASLLESLMELTGSRFGMLTELDEDGDERSLIVHATAGQDIPELPADVESRLPVVGGATLIARALDSEDGLISQDARAELLGIPDCREPGQAEAAALLPMRLGARTVGLLAVAGSEGGYDRGLLAFLAPFVATCAQLVDASRNVQRRREAEREVRRLNATLERRVRERTAELEVANLELEAFSYSVSHDLRQPLRAISGFAQVLLDEYADVLDERAHGYLARVRDGGVRMGQVIDDLLTLSRVTRSELHKARVDLSAVARAVVAELAESEPGRSVAVDVDDAMVVAGDANLLRIALGNLIGNAWKFTARAPAAMIHVGSCEQEGATAYFVRDNGVGFDMEFAEKLFHAFERLHDARDFPGSGVGLAIVDRVVGRHGGQVWAESTPGQGATFYFTLG
jgi:signal transduction histidine kinase